MKNGLIELLKINVSDLQVHSSAVDAFLLTQKLHHQIRPEQTSLNCLEQKTFSLPIVEARNEQLNEISKNRYFFFANWVNLQVQQYEQTDQVCVIRVAKRPANEIRHQAWLYASSLLSFSIHRNSTLRYSAQFF